jgi:hypothetical protein
MNAQMEDKHTRSSGGKLAGTLLDKLNEVEQAYTLGDVSLDEYV